MTSLPIENINFISSTSHELKSETLHQHATNPGLVLLWPSYFVQISTYLLQLWLCMLYSFCHSFPDPMSVTLFIFHPRSITALMKKVGWVDFHQWLDHLLDPCISVVYTCDPLPQYYTISCQSNFLAQSTHHHSIILKSNNLIFMDWKIFKHIMVYHFTAFNFQHFLNQWDLKNRFLSHTAGFIGVGDILATYITTLWPFRMS